MAAMEYLSQRDVDALAAAKRLDARLEVRTTRVQHRRVEERKESAYLWLKLAVLAAALVAAWVYARYRAMRLLYPAEVEWFSERYTLGPRPAGAENYSLDCLLVSAEYPAFAHAFRSQACGSLPQTSAIFLLTMLQMFGDKMEGVHYSGDRAQLRGAKAGEFVKTFSAWNVPDNPWRFLSFTSSFRTSRTTVSIGDTITHVDYAPVLHPLFDDPALRGGTLTVVCHVLERDVRTRLFA